MKTQITLQK